jgi:coenzyme F420-dependent glucose-6-phosphate dehydrogenase
VYLGVGTGEALNEYAATGQWPGYTERQARLAEAIDLIRVLWTGDEISYHGRYYQTCKATLYTRPRTAPPIYVSALVPASAAFAGRHGDGLYTVGGKPLADYRQMLARFEAGARAAGKDPTRMPRWIELGVAYTDDMAAALAFRRRYWAGTFVPALFDQKIYTAAMSAENGTAVGDDTILRSTCVSPDPEEHVRFAQQYVDLGFDNLIFHSAGPDQRAFLEGYGRDVLPRLRARRLQAQSA